MKGLLLALQFLTRLPLPFAASGELHDTAPWFPFAGAVVGAVAAVGLYAGSHFDPWAGALFSLILWVLFTGGMHLDGLCDLADGLAAAHRHPERLLSVMKEPHVGSFGVMAIALLLLAKLVLLMLLAKGGNGWTLIFIASWARFGATLWAKTLPPLGGGFGERLSQFSLKKALVPYLLLIVATGYCKPALLASPVALFLWWLFLKRKVGGMNGDCLGAGIEVSEAVLLFFACL